VSTPYTRTAVALHWLIFVALAGMVALGFYVHGLRLSPARVRLVNYHKWLGICLFALIALRLLWRLTHPPPALGGATSALTRRAARLMHWALYALMLAIPVSGWLMSSAKGYRTVWFGVLALPDLVVRNAMLGNRLLTTHLLLNWTLIVLVAGHAAAAFKHHFIDRDDVLVRMLPRSAG
jgi:cytochrome b561